MCLGPKQQKPQIVESSDPQAQAAADAARAERRSAFGYDSTLLGGLVSTAQPSLSKSLLFGS